jgi:hypothetical protein
VVLKSQEEQARKAEHRGLSELRKAERRLSTRRTRGAECVEDSSRRMFLRVRCRCQVLVCRRCDRGQINRAGTCAAGSPATNGKGQRQVRRRYHAIPRGRALHAE